MGLRREDLPDDPEVLKTLALTQALELESLRFQIAVLKRQKYGRSSEQADRELLQMQLRLEDLETRLATRPAHTFPKAPEPAAKPVRRPLPDHLPREKIVHESACACPECGGELRPAGEDVAEVLERIPERFKVIRHVRPKFSCVKCQKLVQAAAPSRPIARGLAGAGLLAHVLVSKYADHLPLYRQSAIFAREGIDLDRSTLADWVGSTSELLRPLIECLSRYVLSAQKLHADDTPVPVLAPGRGTTKQGRLWTYVRDDRPAGSTEPPAVLMRYSPDRKGERPEKHLTTFSGILQADGYAGFNGLYDRPKDPLIEAACWAHARRKFFDLHAARASPTTAEALARIGELYAIEEEIRGKVPDERRAMRQARAGPALDALHAWLHEQLSKVAKKSEFALAIRYTLSRWTALTRYRDDGRIEIDNNAAERSLRAVALGRKNWLFAGSDEGGDRAAAIYSLLTTARLNRLNIEAYLRLLLERLPEHPINRIEELLPWAIAAEMPDLKLAA